MVALRALEPRDESAVRQAQAEFDGDFEFLPQFDPLRPFPDYLSLLERQRLGLDLPITHVPSTFLVAEAAGEIVGRVYLRHRRNERLRRDGGHVGYGIRPAYRGRGYSVEILRQSVEVLAELGIEEALVTVAEDNLASRRTVERCGGRLGDIVAAANEATRMCRYWVPT